MSRRTVNVPGLVETDVVVPLGIRDGLTDRIAGIFDHDPDIGNGLDHPLAILLVPVLDLPTHRLRGFVVGLGKGSAGRGSHHEQADDDGEPETYRTRLAPVCAHVGRRAYKDWGTRPEILSPVCCGCSWPAPTGSSPARTNQSVATHSAVAPATCAATSTAGTLLKYWT